VPMTAAASGELKSYGLSGSQSLCGNGVTN
jgi:hypothetical protein